ncbi:MAG: carboxyltransferase domain-containing protein [Symbiobacteriaceae bacterium]
MVEFGNEIAPAIHARVRALTQALQVRPIRGVVEVVPTYRSLLVYFDPMQVDPAVLEQVLLDRVRQREALQLPQPEPVDAPAPVMQRPVTVMVGEQQLRGYLGSDGRTWAPVRDVAEALGALVTWDDGKVVIDHERR